MGQRRCKTLIQKTRSNSVAMCLHVMQEAKAAFTTPEAQAALQKYQSYGKGVGVMVKLQV